MSIISRAIPGLFGGASQQIPAMRHPTQGEVQENGLATSVDGLYKRPGSTFVGQMGTGWASGFAESLVGNVHCHAIDRGVSKRWMTTILPDSLMVTNMDTGAAEPVVYKDAAGAVTTFPAYLTSVDPQTAFRCLTVADTTFLVNAEKTVTSVNTDGAVAPDTEAYVYVRQAAPLHTFTIRVGGTPASFTSAAATTVKDIVDGLAAAVSAVASTSCVAVVAVNGLLKITSLAGFTVSVTDTFGNSCLLALTNGVPKFSDLPPSFVTDVRLTITGTGGGPNSDSYYVQWDGKQWQECRKYGVDTALIAGTMPHKLYKDGTDWVVQPITWIDRLVGDDNTNPFPSFLGKKIRSVFFYRNRLGFLSAEGVILGRPGDYYNFFSTTATAVLDSDPIDLGGTAEAVDTLDHAVPMGEQLIIWASKNQQFSLVSGDVLSPANARLLPVTAFSSSNTASPKQLGGRILYPATVNGYTQLSLYRVSMDTKSNKSEEISGHVPAYIPPEPRSLEVSEAAKIAAVVPQGLTGSVFVFKYEDDGEKLTQRAWQTFTFAGSIVKAHWSQNLLYLVVLNRNSTSTGGSTLSLEVIDFNTTATDLLLSFGMRLDRRSVMTNATATDKADEVFVTSPAPDVPGMKVYRWSGGEPQELPIISKVVNAVSPVTVTYRVKATSNLGTFATGLPYNFKYTFTEVFMRDAEGTPVMDSNLYLLKMFVRYVNTGYFKATVRTKAQGVYTYSYMGMGVGLVSQLLNATSSLTSGDYAIPVHSASAGTTVTLESDSVLPCRFPYAEWKGNLTMKSRR